MESSRTTAVQATAIVTTALAVIITALRLYVRIYMIKRVGYDDASTIMATLFMIVVTGLVMTASTHGFGNHIQSVELSDLAYGIEMLRISQLFSILSTVLAKLAICLFLLRLFDASRAWKIFLWTFIAFNSITSCIVAALVFPQCSPVQYNWDKSIPNGSCWPDQAIIGIGVMQGCIAAATDFLLSCVPIIFLWDTRIKVLVKVGICAIMALGVASGVFAIVRTSQVPGLFLTHDPTYDLVPVFIWGLLESNFNVIAAAAPAVRPLFGHNTISSSKARSSCANAQSADVEMQQQ